MLRKCNLKKGKSNDYYSRKELEKLAEDRLKMKKSDIRKLTKRELCRLLNIDWVEPVKVKVNLEKVCTDKNCKKLYPNRLSKDKLIELVREKNPEYSKSQISNMKIPDICKLLKIRYVKCPSTITKKPIAPKSKSDAFVSTTTDPGSCINRSKIVLQPHQRRVVDFLENHRGIIIYHKVGSGKTLTAITISQCFLDRYTDYKVIVITPASLISNFKKQMMDYGNIRHGDKYHFYSFQEFLEKQKKKQISCEKSLLIIDEAHNLKTPYKKSKKKVIGITSKFVIECAKKSTKVIALTATPITNSVKDAINLYNLIKEPMEPLMVNTKDVSGNEISYSSDKLLEKLRYRISFFNDVDYNYYPRRIEKNEFIVMTPSYQKKYIELFKDELLSDIAIKHFGKIDIKAFYNGFRRAVNILEDEDSPKIKWTLNKIKSLKPNEKTIIFSNFLDAGNKAIIKHLPENLKNKYAYINGSISKNKRAEIVNKYNNNELLLLFISKAGGEGLDLKGTRNIILLEPSWNISAEEQIIGRGVRYKSHILLPEDERNVTVYHLYLIMSDDQKFLKTNSKNETIVMNHSTSSIDLLLHFLKKHKENDLNDFRKELIKYSI